jgi:hypothetical protein
MGTLILGVITPLICISLYVVWEMVRYNPQSTNTIKDVEHEDNTTEDN